MSSQMNSFGAGDGASPRVWFLQALSEGMHAVVQPLAIAQANLELVLFKGKTLEDYKQAAEDSLSHMFRGMELLTYVHELIRANRVPDNLTPVPVAASLEAALEDLRQILAEKQLQVSVQIDDPAMTVYGTAERLRQVFFYVLQAAQLQANAGDTVTVRVPRLPEHEMSEAFIAITAPVSATTAPLAGSEIDAQDAESTKEATQAIQAQVMRSLTLAEAIVMCQQGEIECVMAPFGVRLRFSVAQGDNASRIMS